MNPEIRLKTRCLTEGLWRQWPWLPVCFLLSWSGCSWAHPSSDSIRYYILAIPENTNQIRRPKEPETVVLLLSPIVLPSYLQSKRMAVRSGSNEIQYSDFDQWGERLDQGIVRVLGKAMNRATPVLLVVHPQEGGAVPNWEIRIRILACEGVRVGPSEGSIQFEMVWEISAPGAFPPNVHRGGCNAPRMVWNPNNPGELARLLSDAVADAAIRLASDIPPTPRGAPSAPAPASTPRARL
jgi:uncharacterized lipoprotein YmbA